jgi:hypothetical protein
MAKSKVILRGFVNRGIGDSDQSPLIKVWCPYCDQFHVHGWPWKPKDWRYKEYRRAHCDGNLDSPFHETGYYIAEFKQKDIQDIKDTIGVGG